MKSIIGLVLAFSIGIACRLSGVPLPAPPALIGALLVLSMTTGYVLMDRRMSGGKPSPNANGHRGESGGAAS
ncbi:MAG: DUF1427 family protein [Pseudomonadota bacterium]